MRLTGWHVDQFGHLHGRSVTGVGPHLTVLVGPNETGKTTTHHFLRWVLFGFPSSNTSSMRRYRAGARSIGGRIAVEHQGRPLVVERHSKAPGAAQLLAPGGAPVTDVAMSDVVGSTTLELYESVFAVGVDELRDLQRLDQAAVREQIFAAGLVGAGRSAADALHDLDGRRQSLLSPRKGHLRDLGHELANAEAALAAATDESRHLGARREEADVLEARAAAVWTERDQAREEAERYERLEQLWPVWSRARRAAAELEHLPQDDLGPDPLGRLDAELQGVAAATDRLRRRQAERQARAAELDALARPADGDAEADRRLLAVADGLEAALESCTAEAARRADLGGRRAAWAERWAAETARLGELGPDWSPERVLNSPLTLAGLAEMDRHRAALAAAGEAASLAEHDAGRARRDLAAAEQELATRTGGHDGHDGHDGDDGDAPDPDAATERLARAQALRRAVEDLHLQRDRAAERPAAHRPTAVVLAGLAALALVAAVAILAAGAPVPAAAAAVVVLASGAGAVVLARRAPVAVAPDVATGDPAHEVARQARELGLTGPVTTATVDDLIGRLVARHRLATHAEAARGSVARARAAQQQADERVAAAHQVLDRRRADWAQSLESLGLPDDLGPAAATALVQRVVAVRTELERLVAERTELDRLDRELERLADGQRRLLADAGVPPSGDGVRARAAALAEVRARLERITTVSRRAAELERNLEDLDREVALAEADLTTARAGLARRFQAAGVDGEDGYRALVRSLERADHLRQVVQSADQEVLQSFGRGEPAEAARKELDLGRVTEWSGRAAAARARAAELEERHQELHRQGADARRALERVERSADVVARAMEVDRLRHELAAAAQEWVQLTLARDATARTLEHFERDRQPEVVAWAGRAFARITGERWSGIVTGADRIEVVDATEARLVDASLSRGTTEQLYLCMRLGLALSHARRNVALPMLLDDVLVNADDDRRARVAELLAEVADDVQVLVFTAHRSTAELLARVREDTRIIELA